MTGEQQKAALPYVVGLFVCIVWTMILFMFVLPYLFPKLIGPGVTPNWGWKSDYSFRAWLIKFSWTVIAFTTAILQFAMCALVIRWWRGSFR